MYETFPYTITIGIQHLSEEVVCEETPAGLFLPPSMNHEKTWWTTFYREMNCEEEEGNEWVQIEFQNN